MPGENKEGKIKSSEFTLKSSIRVCVHRKSSEWKESRESRKSRIVAYSRRKVEFEVDQHQYLNGDERP